MIANRHVRINEKLIPWAYLSILTCRVTKTIMTGRLIPKKKPSDIRKGRLTEPELDRKALAMYHHGIELFNEGRFWDAHEAWEEVWRECEEESRIFFQGIIQVAAGYHLLTELPRPAGARRNLTKAREKLVLFEGVFLGIDVDELRGAVEESLRRLGSQETDVPIPTIGRRDDQ